MKDSRQGGTPRATQGAKDRAGGKAAGNNSTRGTQVSTNNAIRDFGQSILNARRADRGRD
jgi:hypothetical protein